MFDEAQISYIKKLISETVRNQPRLKLIQSDVPPGTIKRRHVEDVVIVFGDSNDRPTTGSDGVKSYFSTDTGVLSCWDGSQWLETTLS